VKFLIDAQLPPALAEWLRQAGYESQSVRDAGLRDAEDFMIWQYAQTHGWVILTKDEDFALRAMNTPEGPTVVWLRVGNTSNAALRAWLLPQLPDLVSLFRQGHSLIEVR
jgi:predicted nuclease of predicted toxin-antitoxin system